MNIAGRLRQAAGEAPVRTALIDPSGRRLSFGELEQQTNRLAQGLGRMGVQPGMRLVLFVPFGIEFIALTYALLKRRAVAVLIDPGMGRGNTFRCLEAVEPDGFVAVPKVHALRTLMRSRFAKSRLNVTVGRRWFWGGETYDSLRRGTSEEFSIPETKATDPAAVIFTSGSTGAPKGVLYEHGMFDAQVELIRSFYGIAPGEIDLPGFPLFGLFNAAMGVTTVIPDMDPTRPAGVDPAKIIAAVRAHGVTQAFGSPAFWNRIGRYCEQHGIQLPTIGRALSAGGPAPLHVLRRVNKMLTGDGADLHTPYGATESLPVASIGAREVLAKTAALTSAGAGTCVGRVFPGIRVKIIAMSDSPIRTWPEVTELPAGEIGEIIVQGPSVTREYFRRRDATELAKIPDDAPAGPDGERPFWHRMGDVGYFDSDGLLWFCGRKAHVLETSAGRMFSVCCEGIFDEHPAVFRSALVGVGNKPAQRPVLVVEPEPDQWPADDAARQRLVSELLAMAAARPLTCGIRDILLHRSLPVDTRHNVKINRELLADWAANELATSTEETAA